MVDRLCHHVIVSFLDNRQKPLNPRDGAALRRVLMAQMSDLITAMKKRCIYVVILNLALVTLHHSPDVNRLNAISRAV